MSQNSDELFDNQASRFSAPNLNVRRGALTKQKSVEVQDKSRAFSTVGIQSRKILPINSVDVDDKPVARQSSGRNFTMPAMMNKKALSKSMTEPNVGLDEMATFRG